MNRHYSYGKYQDLVGDPTFLRLLCDTRDSWDLNKRGAKLADFGLFERSVQANIDLLAQLSGHRIERLDDHDLSQVLPRLESLFISLVVMEMHSRIVGVSKALHFLLPNLVMPVDRENVYSPFLIWVADTQGR